MKTVNDCEPFYLCQTLGETIFTTRREPSIGIFYNNSKGKIGRQKLSNKLKFMDYIKFDYLYKPLPNHGI